MTILDTTTRSLEITLDSTPDTNELDWLASAVEFSGSAYLPVSQSGVSNGVTPVTILSAPSGTDSRQVKYIGIFNRDTAARIVTVTYNDNATLRAIISVLLQPGFTLQYNDGRGWSAFDGTPIIMPSSIFLPSTLGDVFGFYIDGPMPGVTSATIYSAHSLGGFLIRDTDVLATLSLPNLIDVDPTSSRFTGGWIDLEDNASLVSVDLPVLTAIGAGNTFTIKNNPLLTALNLPVFVPNDFATYNWTGNAFTAATVNAILATWVAAVGGLSGGSLDLRFGSAAPTGQGILDKATLIAAGVTVSTT